jgi:hypothetical protein
MCDGTSKLSARCSTYACGLLVSINTTSASGLRLKYSIIFWAFEPDPDAKMAIRFFKITGNLIDYLSNINFYRFVFME